MVRDDDADFIYKGEDGKYDAAVDDIVERHSNGPARPRRHDLGREVGEAVAPARRSSGIPHEVLNAKQHEREAEIITQAGQLGVGHRRHEHGRAAASTSCSAATPRASPGGSASARASSLGTDEYQARYDELLPRFEEECKVEGDKVRALGGLYVLGTERHESRRIDNQLRGRSGRQGDPGESRFYLSLEDELMRLFATGLMQRVMGASFPDDVPLESKMVSKAVERAQRTVEDRNFEIRKNVLKYDEVMNEQRKVIYKRRQQVLDGEDLRDAAHRGDRARDRPPGRPALRGRVRRGVGRRRAARRGEDVLPDARHQGAARRRRRRSTRPKQLLFDDAVALYEDEGSSTSATRRCATSSAA